MLDKIIENFNLEEKEAKVYLAALALGKSKVSEIAANAQLNRITTYEILKRLATRGIASRINYKKIIYFQVIDPGRLLAKMESQTEQARTMLPQLLLLKKDNSQKPTVEYFSGPAGLKTIYENTLNCDEKVIYNIANVENLLTSIGVDFLDTYIEKRAKKGIRIKVLIPDTKIAHEYINHEKNKNPLRELKFFDNADRPIPNEIMIYDDKVALLSFFSKIGVVIEDKDIAESLKSVWKLLWQKS